VGRFDSNAAALAARLAGQGPDAQRELTDWLVGLVSARSGMRILDVGSGLGIPALALAEIVGPAGTVVALDRSLDALVALRESAAEGAGRQVLVPVCQDFDSLGARRARLGAFHRVTAVYSLYYSRAPLRTLLALRSMLRRDGRLVVAGPHPLSNRTFRDLCRKAYGRPIPSTTPATRFMTGLLPAVLPRLFPYVRRRVLVTQVVFSDTASLLAYWRAHNWYEPAKEDKIRQIVRAAFRESDHLTFAKRTAAFVASAAPVGG
jgi:SAM-dependent methyltransferase